MEKVYSELEKARVAQEILNLLHRPAEGATVLALTGDLGAGKTTLTQEIAKALGVLEQVNSPTFVIMKKYQTDHEQFSTVAHIDAYRIENDDELLPLRFTELLQEPRTLIIIEWPERIAAALPIDTNHFSISHEGEFRRIKKHA